MYVRKMLRPKKVQSGILNAFQNGSPHKNMPLELQLQDLLEPTTLLFIFLDLFLSGPVRCLVAVSQRKGTRGKR